MHKTLSSHHITFIGAGSMAEALIKGLIQTKITEPDHITVTNRANTVRLQQLSDIYHVRTTPDLRSATKQADVIVLCTKPSDMGVALAAIGAVAPESALYVSVAAGLSIAFIKDALSRSSQAFSKAAIRIVRAMPNTSAAVLQSASAYTMSDQCSLDDEDLVQSLLGSVGLAIRVDESVQNTVTAVSGSGPAYVYYFVEQLIAAGVTAGLSTTAATELVIQTLLGAATMLVESHLSPADLRRQVTSPNGTTMAGIAMLTEQGFPQAIQQAVQATKRRAEEIGSTTI